MDRSYRFLKLSMSLIYLNYKRQFSVDTSVCPSVGFVWVRPWRLHEKLSGELCNYFMGVVQSKIRCYLKHILAICRNARKFCRLKLNIKNART